MLLFFIDKKYDWLYKYNFKIIYYNYYNKLCLYFFYVVFDFGRYIRVNIGIYVLVIGIYVSLSI